MGPAVTAPSIRALPNLSSHLAAPSAETTLSAWEGSHKNKYFSVVEHFLPRQFSIYSVGNEKHCAESSPLLGPPIPRVQGAQLLPPPRALQLPPRQSSPS